MALFFCLTVPMNHVLEKHRDKLVILILLLTPVALMATSSGAQAGTGSISSPGGWTRGAILTGQTGVIEIFGGAQGIIASWFVSELSRENASLREELALLREEKARLIGVLQENARLRSQVGFKDAHPEFELVPARVIARDTTPYFRVLTVKIQHEGADLKPRMPVVVAGGVVGQIHRVHEGWADVIVLSDPRSHIDTLSQRNRAHGVVQGLGRERDYRARVSYLSEKDDIQPGDTMVTSGMGGVFPRELIIGTVLTAAPDERGLFQEVTLAPSVDFSRLDMVYVITNTQRPEIGEE